MHTHHWSKARFQWRNCNLLDSIVKRDDTDYVHGKMGNNCTQQKEIPFEKWTWGKWKNEVFIYRSISLVNICTCTNKTHSESATLRPVSSSRIMKLTYILYSAMLLTDTNPPPPPPPHHHPPPHPHPHPHPHPPIQYNSCRRCIHSK